MVERVSALAAILGLGVEAPKHDPHAALRLGERRDMSILQVAVWPETLESAGRWMAEIGGAPAAPGPGRSIPWAGGRLLRVEPLKWWAVNAAAPECARLSAIGADQGAALDLSHSRTVMRVEGQRAGDLLARFMAIDFSDARFPDGAVAAARFDHIAALAVRCDAGQAPGFDVYVHRSYAVSAWVDLLESANQLGVTVGAFGGPDPSGQE